MCTLQQTLKKYVFYDAFVSWCAVRLSLLLKVCRDIKKSWETLLLSVKHAGDHAL